MDRVGNVEELHGPFGIVLTECGQGPPIFLMHGIGNSAEVFDPQCEGLGEEHHLVAWDAPGYARSADPSEPLSMDDYALRALACVQKYFEEPAYVIGMSWGGVIATRLAAKYPEWVRGLILGASTVGSATTSSQATGMYQRVSELERLGVAEFSRSRSSRLVTAEAPDEIKRKAKAVMEKSIRVPGYASAARAMAETDNTGLLGDVSVPTLILWGEDDTVTGPGASLVLQSGIAQARGVEIKGAGHLVNLEEPDEFNAQVASFIQDVEASAR